MSTVAHRMPVSNDSSAGSPARRKSANQISRRLRWTALALASVAAGAALVGALYGLTGIMAPEPTPRIVFVTGGSGPYWQLAAEGARAAARGASVDLQLVMPSDDGDVASQSALLDEIDPPAFGGVAVCPLNADLQSEQLQKLGIATKLVTFDADAPQSRRLCHYGLRNYAAARTYALAVRQALPDGGEALVLAADLDRSDVADRINGLTLVLAHDEFANELSSSTTVVVVESLADGGDPARCAENIRQALVDHPRLACIVDMTPRSCATMVQSLAAAGRAGDIKLFALDQSDETLDAIERGEVHAAIVRDPYQCGFQAVRGLLAFSRYSSLELPVPGHGSISVPARIVRQGNVGEFRRPQTQEAADKWGG